MKILRLWRLLQYPLLGVAVVITLAGFLVAFEDWHGPRALRVERARLQAEGESLDFSAFLPPPLPAEQNFMADPFLQMLDGRQPADPAFSARYDQFNDDTRGFSHQLESWSEGAKLKFSVHPTVMGKDRELSPSEVMVAFSPIEADILRLRLRAEECPLAQFDPKLDGADDFIREQSVLDHLLQVSELSKNLTWRAAAELDEGKGAPAFADTLILMRIEKAIESYPTLLSGLAGSAIDQSVTQVFWQGTVSGAWTPAQLEVFRDFFISVHTWVSYVRDVRGECALLTRILTDSDASNHGIFGVHPVLAFLMQPGLAAENVLVAEAAAQEVIACFDPLTGRFDVDRARRYLRQNESRAERANPYHFLGRNITRIYLSHWPKWPPAEDAGAVVAALELYHLVQHDYPAKLADLVPRYLPRVPTGALTGESPAYRRIDESNFQLSSARAPEPQWTWHQQPLKPGPSVARSDSKT